MKKFCRTTGTTRSGQEKNTDDRKVRK